MHFVIKGANKNAKDKYLSNVIHNACQNGHLPIGQNLIEKQNVDI